MIDKKGENVLKQQEEKSRGVYNTRLFCDLIGSVLTLTRHESFVFIAAAACGTAGSAQPPRFDKTPSLQRVRQIGSDSFHYCNYTVCTYTSGTIWGWGFEGGMRGGFGSEYGQVSGAISCAVTFVPTAEQAQEENKCLNLAE